MEWNTIIKLLLILLFSIHVLYNFKENFTSIPILNLDVAEGGYDGGKYNMLYHEPEIKKKYLDVAEGGYDAGKYNIQYHEPVELIEKKNKDDYNYDYIKVSPNDEDEQVKRLRIQSKILYKDPIEYKYGITPYVPSYTDTVLLSTLRPHNYDFSKAF